MTWNHRVIKTKDGEDDFYYIAEVYYDEDKPRGYTEKPVGACGNSIDELKKDLERMLRCLDKPVLTENDFRES